MLRVILVEVASWFKSNQGIQNYSEDAVAHGSPSSVAFWSCLFSVADSL